MQEFFSKKNLLVISGGTLLLILGFYLLGRGPADNALAMNVAPFILIFVYLVVLPIGILMSNDKIDKK